jgi:hypothetical protein
MNRSAFYASARARASGIFGTSLSRAQVEGCEASGKADWLTNLLDAIIAILKGGKK